MIELHLRHEAALDVPHAVAATRVAQSAVYLTCQFRDAQLEQLGLTDVVVQLRPCGPQIAMLKQQIVSSPIL